jgi:hypothetical protein
VPKRNKTEPTTRPGMTQPGAKPNKPGSRRKPARAKGRKKMAHERKATSGRPVATPEPTDDEIRTHAYFISERRRRLGLAGDTSSDWLEAKKQLLSETGPR